MKDGEGLKDGEKKLLTAVARRRQQNQTVAMLQHIKRIQEELDQMSQMLRTSLYHKMVNAFGQDDIKQITFELGLDYNNIPADTLRGKIRELIVICVKNDQLDQLINICRTERPGREW